MSAVDNGRNNTPIRQRTLLDIIKDDRTNKDKKSWKTFRDKLRLKRAGSAWTSSVRIPTSDVNVLSSRSRSFRHASEDGGDSGSPSDHPVANSRMQLGRRVSGRFSETNTDNDNPDAPPSRSKPQMTRHPSSRIGSGSANDDHWDEDDSDDEDDEEDQYSPEEEESPRPTLAEGRVLSAREAVVAQEAAEAAAAAAEKAAAAEDEPVKMSLMDLLGDMGEDDEYDEEDEGDEKDVAVVSSAEMECTCCVCMVKHKGSGFVPCGHTFCRLCSRELTVQRGNCPLCNGYILEILDIF